jgi:hypothetical protein
MYEMKTVQADRNAVKIETRNAQTKPTSPSVKHTEPQLLVQGQVFEYAPRYFRPSYGS